YTSRPEDLESFEFSGREKLAESGFVEQICVLPAPPRLMQEVLVNVRASQPASDGVGDEDKQFSNRDDVVGLLGDTQKGFDRGATALAARIGAADKPTVLIDGAMQ